MSQLSRRKMLATLAVAPLAAGVVARTASSNNSSDNQVSKTALSSREKLRNRYFPNFELTTHEGKKVRFYDDLIKDKIVVINFMYAKCEGVCMPITTNLKRVQNLLGDRVGRDIFMYSITLKPQEDTPRKLKEYVRMHRIKPGWTFLTGKPEEIDKLRRSLGFKDAKPRLDKDLTNHTGMVKYGNEARQWWAMFPGRANAPWIVESISWMDGPNAKHTHAAPNASQQSGNDQNPKDQHAGHKMSESRPKGRNSLKRKGGQR